MGGGGGGGRRGSSGAYSGGGHDDIVGAGGGQGPAGEDRTPSGAQECPSDFRAEIQDIDPGDWEWAAQFPLGTLLEIVLAEGDPQFANGGRTVGWLSTNRDAVAACLEAGWRYTGDIIEVTPTVAGPRITTRVQASAP